MGYDDPKPEDYNKAASINNPQTPVQGSPSVSDHLPGRQNYDPVTGPRAAGLPYLSGSTVRTGAHHSWDTVAQNIHRSGNPRRGMSVPQWLRGWEDKWERISGGYTRNGKPKL
ncbi:hypothetical protein N7G274_003661 [Stereocaulon virgatum]|uniref:Uncharacterized protein n=1 Tax=Stereocaulon virgatum TaxID=373712 RepID=A0ABR4AC62_9LECA